MSQILVIGSRGTVGSEIVKQLSAKGHKVIEATSQKKLKPRQVHLDLVSQTGLATAFDNIEKVFILSPPGYTNQDELLSPLINKAIEKKLKKVVLMTAMGVNANPEAPMRKVEILLENSGLNYNIIRPNWFMQNFNSYWLDGILKDGKIYLPVENAKGSFIDARDIASTAVALLESNNFNNQDFDLTGIDVLNHNEVAEILSRTSGVKITYQNITPSLMFEGLLKAGLPKAYAEFMLVILGYFKEGYSERTTNAVEKITGLKPISFKKYAEDYKDAWIKK